MDFYEISVCINFNIKELFMCLMELVLQVYRKELEGFWICVSNELVLVELEEEEGKFEGLVNFLKICWC